jgi:hypothetical protein
LAASAALARIIFERAAVISAGASSAAPALTAFSTAFLDTATSAVAGAFCEVPQAASDSSEAAHNNLINWLLFDSVLI